MTTGSYNRNFRVPTPGKYSGPYTVGLLQTKTWSGTNYPAGKPLRTNVKLPLQTLYRYKTVYDRVPRRVERFRYVKTPCWVPVTIRNRPANSIDPRRSDRNVFRPRGRDSTTSPRLPNPRLRLTYVWVKERYWVTKFRKQARLVPVAYIQRPSRSYFRPPKRGRSVDHVYSCNYQTSVTGIVNYTIPGVGNFSNPTNGVVSSFVVSTDWSSNDDLNLIGKLRERIAGSDFNAGVVLAEGHKTLAMIAENATRIYKGISALKHGNLSAATAHLAGHVPKSKRPKSRRSTTAQSRWLELQYGWLPLLQDVMSGAQFLAHQLSVPIMQTVRVSREKKGSVTWSGTAGWRYDKSEILSRSSIKATIAEKDIAQLSGLTDPASVAWELVPYSFVVDWFIPIGAYLSARGLSQALTGTFVTSKTYRERHSGFIPFGQNITGLTYQGSAYLEQGTMSRTLASNLAIPLPSMKPLIKVASWKHCVNAIALLTSFQR